MSKNIACESSIELSQRRPFAASDVSQEIAEESGIMPTTSGGGDGIHSLIDVNEVPSGINDYELMDETPTEMHTHDGTTAIGDDLRMFFDQIMVPELQLIHGGCLQPPPDLTAWMPEVDHFGELDLFESSFVPNMDQIFEPQFGTQYINGTPGSLNASDTMQPINDRGYKSTPRQRDGGIRHSPWYVNSIYCYSMVLTCTIQALSHLE
jgi:hypothetical protein